MSVGLNIWIGVRPVRWHEWMARHADQMFKEMS